MTGQSKTYFIKTYGCQMNQAESERLAAVFEAQGYQPAKNINQADTIIINTCSVRESAENRVFGLIRNLTGATPVSGKIILTGCMVGSGIGERRRYSLKALKQKLPHVDEFLTINELIGQSKVTPKRPARRQAGKKKSHAFVPIMYGCNHFCTYCVVPYARGEEVSRPFEEVVEEVECLAKQGFKHITLLGQNVNSYAKSSKFKVQSSKLFRFNRESSTKSGQLKVKKLRNKYKNNFALLLAVLHEIPGIKKISFITSNPWDLNDDIIEAMKLPKIDRHLHLPVQSGDNKILQKMNRPYTSLQYIKLVEKIKKQIPSIKISTDIIVGFPGETKQAFENTVKLCKKIGFTKAYIAKYSPRPGTAAFKMKNNVSPGEKKRRWQVLEKLINQ